MNETARTHYFPVQNLKVITELIAGEYVAYIVDDFYSPIGCGKSRMEAIVKLRELLKQAGQIE